MSPDDGPQRRGSLGNGARKIGNGRAGPIDEALPTKMNGVYGSLPVHGQGYERLRTLGFTRREADVALLVVRRCTNREIADALCCSISNVKRRLERMFPELGVTNRRELARVVEHTLVSTDPSP